MDPMDGSGKMRGSGRLILRKSIHVFLQHYHYFTITSALMAFPFSVSFLLSQDFLLSSPSSYSFLYARLGSLFQAAKFPIGIGSPNFFSIANLKLSQTVSSSLLALPFTLTFLLFAKASVVHFLEGKTSSLASTYFAILRTYVCTWLVLLSANATAFFLMFFAFSNLGSTPSSHYAIFLSAAASAVLYSVILANAIIVCNLGLVLSGVEGISGSLAIVRAFIMIRGRTSIALSLAVPLNIALAASEALFQFRVSRTFHGAGTLNFPKIFEGLFIAYLYSVLMVLENIVNLMLFKSCKRDEEFEDRYHRQVQALTEEEEFVLEPKSSKQVPESHSIVIY